MAFKNELIELINRHSMENGSNTPDFILGEYLLNCLKSYEIAMKQRDAWYGDWKHHHEVFTPKTDAEKIESINKTIALAENMVSTQQLPESTACIAALKDIRREIRS